MDIVQTLYAHLPTFALDVIRLCVWLALLSAIFVPLERLFPLYRQKVFRPELVTDLAYYFLSSLLPKMLLIVPLAILGWGLHRFVPGSLHRFAGELPLWARFAAALLVAEIGFYWGHRLSHEIPLLWRFHSVHHSAEQIDFLVNTRAHPVDMVFTRLCGLIPLYVLGLAQPLTNMVDVMPLLIVLVSTVWGFFIHANLCWRFGWLEWLVSTPAFHHWHHTLEDHKDHNYASMFPFIDRLFGTFYLPKEWPAAYGTDKPMPETLTGQLLEPLAR
jgi:sterol desaturase/sphingolipid hydroxylase (fatty acid hydroxylase superfamily)